MADTRVPRSSSPSTASAPVNTAVHASGSSSWLTPERVAHAEFRSSFRGLDGAEVRSFLARVAAELRGLLERETELLARVEAAEERQVVTAAEPLDVQQVSDMLGQETARVLSMAREAAADIKSRAHAEAAALTAAAVSEAERLRTESEGLVGERGAEAEAAAAEILARTEAAAEQLRGDSVAEAERVRQEADSYAQGVRDQADQAAAELRVTAKSEADIVRAEASAAAEQLRTETAATTDAALSRAKESAAVISAAAEARRDELISAATAERDAAREEGKRMVGEARAVRERILGDMARRRNVSRQQLERVRAARERLLDAIEGVRQGVIDVQAELAGSLVEAKLAGDRAARAIDVNDVPALRELEAEVRLARDTGLIDDQSVQAASSEQVSEEAESVGEHGEADAIGEVSDDADLSDPATGELHSAGDDESGRGRLLASPASEGAAVEGTTGPVRGRIQISPFNAGFRGVTDRSIVRVPAAGPVPERSIPEPEVPTEHGEPEVPTEHGMVIDLRDHAEGPRGSDPGETQDGDHDRTIDEPTDAVFSTGHEASSAGRTGPIVPRRGSRRERSSRRTEDLFARLRAADDGTSGAPNGNVGVVALVGPAPEPSMVTPSDPIEEVTVLALPETVPEAEHGAADAREAAVDDGDVESDEPVELDPDRVALHTRDAVLAGPMRDLSRQLKLALSDQQNEMLQARRNPDLKRLLNGDNAAAAPTFGEIASALGEACVGELMVAWSLGRRSVQEDDEVAAEADDVAGEVSALARRIVTLLEERLGEPEEDTGAWDVDRVRSAYREVRSQRLAELVEFNLYSAYAAGQLAAADAGSRARWVSDACGPDCMDNALADDVSFGEAFPTGHLAPPSFPGCRCCLVRAD